MIHAAIDSIQQTIVNLSILERYGGLCFTAQKMFSSGDPENPAGVMKSFPVGVNIEEPDCWNNGKYSFLMPSMDKKSVAWWMPNSGMTLKTGGRLDKGLDTVIFQGSAKLIVWLNLQALGFETNTVTADYVAVLVQALHRKEFNVSNDVFTGSKAYFQFQSQDPKTLNIFSPWSFDRKEALMFFPHDFFAINFNIEISISRSCIGDISSSTPLDKCYIF